MAKYSKDLADRICTLLATGETTIADVCKACDISEAIFYKWKTDKVEFLEALKAADLKRMNSLAVMARSGLAKLIDVYEYEETTTEYVDSKDKQGNSVPKIKSRKVTKKRIMPNATAVIFALKNADPENFRDRHEVDHTTGGAPFKAYAGFDLDGV